MANDWDGEQEICDKINSGQCFSLGDSNGESLDYDNFENDDYFFINNKSIDNKKKIYIRLFR